MRAGKFTNTVHLKSGRSYINVNLWVTKEGLVLKGVSGEEYKIEHQDIHRILHRIPGEEHTAAPDYNTRGSKRLKDIYSRRNRMKE